MTAKGASDKRNVRTCAVSYVSQTAATCGEGSEADKAGSSGERLRRLVSPKGVAAKAQSDMPKRVRIDSIYAGCDIDIDRRL